MSVLKINKEPPLNAAYNRITSGIHTYTTEKVWRPINISIIRWRCIQTQKHLVERHTQTESAGGKTSYYMKI